MTISTAFATDKEAAIDSQTKAQLKEVAALLDSWGGESSILNEARTRLDNILSSHPNYAAAHREYARYYIIHGFHRNNDHDSNDLKSAEKSLKTAIALKPNFAEAYILLGHWYFIQQRYSEAESALTTAEKLGGTTDPWFHNNWADVLIAEGNLEKAASHYLKVIGSNTKNIKVMTAAFAGLADYYTKTQHFDDADKMYKKQFAYEPKKAWPHGNYATFLLCYKDDAKAAINEFKTALQLMNYGIARTGLTAALYRQWADESLTGQISDARATLSEARALMAGNPIEIIESACGNRSEVAVAAFTQASMLTNRTTP
ncbi:MAG: hypothetical protein PHU14_02020 [Methylovulum sp.]|nr:hypothetical protein [Methylovulum sp.]